MNSNKHISLMLDQGYTNILLNKKMDSSLSPHGISFTEFTIMHKLHTSSGGVLSRIALADSIGLTASGVTRLLAPMEKNHIVQKLANPRDARQSMVALTDAGQELYTDSLVSFEHSCNSAFALLEESEIDQLLILLNKIKY
ncbi:Regulatory protein MarR [Vibrio coralliirubri]|uniref:MarR family winged helix-turn-helix transcriptional regulator n=1 Tax=Vibrio coralliirubri TaxID=1516159 RepID=UPI000638BC3D|nr:MarR family winged helix-turn-helix transcriptional regulator [Vibrio coralliirubri]CDT33926.1 Regulatory protein MarR [Vibrio coralliirubri]